MNQLLGVALNKFVEPIKNVFQLPNIVVSRSLGLGKKALSATSKIAGAAFKMTPFGMAMGLTRGMRGKSGKDGKSWEEYKSSRRYQQRQERIEALRNDPTATRTMTVNGKEVILNELDYQSSNESDDAPQFKKSDINKILIF